MEQKLIEMWGSCNTVLLQKQLDGNGNGTENCLTSFQREACHLTIIKLRRRNCFGVIHGESKYRGIHTTDFCCW